MGDRFFPGSLDRFFRKFMAEFALSAVLVEFNVFKMTEVTGGLRDLEFLLIGFVLVARGAVDFLALDLVLFIQMRFVMKLFR